jgi:hypothetical protein
VTGPDPGARYTEADLLLSWEVGRSFGAAEGFNAAIALVDQAVAAALTRPAGHGGPDLDVTAQRAVQDLFRRYLYPRRSDVSPAPRAEHAPAPPGRVARSPR